MASSAKVKIRSARILFSPYRLRWTPRRFEVVIIFTGLAPPILDQVTRW